MTKTHTSNVDEVESQDTAPSEKSAKQTPPEKTDEQVYLVEEMDKLPDLDLVKIGLAAMAILHQRATAYDEAGKPDA